MKKSHQVPASMIVALSASFVANGCGCGPEVTTMQCTDSMGHVLPYSACSHGGPVGAHWVHVTTGGFGGFGGSGGGSFGG